MRGVMTHYGMQRLTSSRPDVARVYGRSRLSEQRANLIADENYN
jgi:hypothetical protein